MGMGALLCWGDDRGGGVPALALRKESYLIKMRIHENTVSPKMMTRSCNSLWCGWLQRSPDPWRMPWESYTGGPRLGR